MSNERSTRKWSLRRFVSKARRMNGVISSIKRTRIRSAVSVRQEILDMLVTILPFFLAAQVALDDYPDQPNQPYLRGPESTFHVQVKMTLSNVTRETDTFCSIIESELNCRPKGSDTLRCRFENTETRGPDPNDKDCSKPRNFLPVKPRFVNGDPFEIRFNTRGIENLVITRTIPRWQLDIIRLIADQLNIGFDLEKGHQQLVVTENSNMGQCEVEVKLNRLPYKGESESDLPFDIVFEPERPEIVSLERARLEIMKVRHPKSCENRKAYFFGNHDDLSSKNHTTFMNMVTSSSHIEISKDYLKSSSEVTGVMKSSEESRRMNLYQKVSLALKSVHYANSPLPEVSNPASASVYAYSDFDRVRRSLNLIAITV